MGVRDSPAPRSGFIAPQLRIRERRDAIRCDPAMARVTRDSRPAGGAPFGDKPAAYAQAESVKAQRWRYGK